MATLTNTKIKDTYVGLLKTTDNQAIDASGVTLVEDGAGNASALSVGRSGNGVTITGTITGNLSGNVTGNLTGTVLTAAQTNITSVGTLSSLAVSGDLTVDTSTLKVDSSNNRVGINTSSPTSELHIVDSAASAFIRLESSSTGLAGIAMGDADLANECRIIFDNSDDSLRFNVNNDSERMRIDSSGRVGIGESSPETLLHVSDSINPPVLRLDYDKEVATWTGGETITELQSFIGDSSGIGKRVVTNIKSISDSSGSTASGALAFFTSANNSNVTEKVRIQSGGGISFNGDTAAANALDDYEEGNFTPTYTTADGDFDTIDYGTQTGRYTKIGRVVYCDLMLRAGNITYSGAVTAASDVRIGGLPFSVIGGFAIASGGISFINNWGNTNNPNSINIQTGTGGIGLVRLSDTASRYAVSVSDLDTGAANSRNDIRMSFFYFV